MPAVMRARFPPSSSDLREIRVIKANVLHEILQVAQELCQECRRDGDDIPPQPTASAAISRVISTPSLPAALRWRGSLPTPSATEIIVAIAPPTPSATEISLAIAQRK
jgi:hypothetical protein